jgi:hypothetical protein
MRLTALLFDPPTRAPYHTGFIRDSSDPSLVITSALLSLGLYINDFVSFSKDPAVETLLSCLLAKRCKADFMGILEWFLGVHFSWRITHSSVAVHLNQSGFATNLVETFACQACNETLTATPYHQEFQLIPLRHLLMLMTLLCRFDGLTLIKISSAASVGCRLLHALTSPWPTPSFPPTQISWRRVT